MHFWFTMRHNFLSYGGGVRVLAMLTAIFQIHIHCGSNKDSRQCRGWLPGIRDREIECVCCVTMVTDSRKWSPCMVLNSREWLPHYKKGLSWLWFVRFEGIDTTITSIKWRLPWLYQDDRLDSNKIVAALVFALPRQENESCHELCLSEMKVV